MKVTIKNTFHGTQTHTTVRDCTISRGRVRRIRQRLCGIGDCCCGGALSERGDWDTHAIEDENGEQMVFSEREWGGRFVYGPIEP